MTNCYIFSVLGNPVPKQSFRAVNGGRGYTDPRVKAWQEKVAYEARYVMDGDEPLTGDLRVSLKFYLSDRRRKDLDNLSKCVLDALNGIVYVDDRQIVDLHLQKDYDKDNPGVIVCVTRVKGRIYAMDGLIMVNEGPGAATVYYQGDPVGTVRQLPGLAHGPHEWRAYNLRGEYVGKAYSGKQAAKLLEEAYK